MTSDQLKWLLVVIAIIVGLVVWLLWSGTTKERDEFDSQSDEESEDDDD